MDSYSKFTLFWPPYVPLTFVGNHLKVHRSGVVEACALPNLAGRGSIPRLGQVAWVRFFRGFSLTPMDECQVTLSGVWNPTHSRHFLFSLIILSPSSPIVLLVFQTAPAAAFRSFWLPRPASADMSCSVVGDRQQISLPSLGRLAVPSVH